MDTENTESVYTSQKKMRSCKVGFFTKDIEKFKNELVDMPYFFYKCTYKYSSDNDGVLDWIASNLNQAFANEIDTSDDIKNRVFCVFRCYQPNKNIKKYEYTSMWITDVSSEEELKTLIGSRYDDYIWESCTDTEQFIKDFQKTYVEKCAYEVEYLEDDDYDTFGSIPNETITEQDNKISVDDCKTITKTDNVITTTEIDNKSDTVITSEISGEIVSEVYVH